MKKNTPNPISILVVGATGLIGSTLFMRLSLNSNYNVFGSIRNSNDKSYFPFKLANKLIANAEASNYQKWSLIFEKVKPDIVINCLGITKHLQEGDDPLITIPINSYFPHYLNSICEKNHSRLIHISSDCVFSGAGGNYLESDIPDAQDLYGRSKALGEVSQGSAITLRTSTIGHELHSSFGLLDWFLAQSHSCQGFKNAYFSGVTTQELSRIIENYVIPDQGLQGLYHVGAAKISKFKLLSQIAHEYDKKIEIIPNYEFKIDRSLNSDRFCEATGYQPPAWSKLIREMHLRK